MGNLLFLKEHNEGNNLLGFNQQTRLNSTVKALIILMIIYQVLH